MKKPFYTKRFLKVFLLCLLVIFLKLPLVINHNPAVWDEINYLEGIVNISENNLNPLTLYWSYHPPFIMWTTAVIYKIFGDLLLTTRLVIIFWSIITAIFTYLLTEEIIGEKIEALGAGILLVFSSLFMAQSGIFQIEVPLAALAVGTIYFYYKKNLIWFSLTSCALVLTKEPALMFLLLIFLFESVTKLKKIKIFSFLLSVLLFLGWMQSNRLAYGWYVWPYNWKLFTNISNNIIENLKIVYLPLIGLSYRVYEIGYWSGVILFLSILGVILNRKKILKEKITFLIILIIFGYPLIFVLGSPLSRYLLPVYPFIFILFSIVLSKINYRKFLFPLPAIIILIFILFLISFWNRKLADWEVNMTYLEVVNNHQEVVSLVTRKYSQRIIATHWPFTTELTKPYLGYVRKGDQFRIFELETSKNLSEFDYVLAEKNSSVLTKITPCLSCLSIKEKIRNEVEEINLYRINKNCFQN